MAPLIRHATEFLLSHNFHENFVALLASNESAKDQIQLFYFLGWRIWKHRNEIVFRGRKWSLPDVRSKTLLDLSQWREAVEFNEQNLLLTYGHTCYDLASYAMIVPGTRQQAIQQTDQFCCFVDAS